MVESMTATTVSSVQVCDFCLGAPIYAVHSDWHLKKNNKTFLFCLKHRQFCHCRKSRGSFPLQNI